MLTGIDSEQNRNKRTLHPGCSPGTCDRAASEAVSAVQPRQSMCETCASHCHRPSNSLQALFQNYELVYVKGQGAGEQPPLTGRNYFNSLLIYFKSTSNYFNRKIIVTSSRLKRLSFPCLMSGTGHQRTCTRPFLNIPKLLKKAEACQPVKRQVKEDKIPTPSFPGYCLFHHCPY